MRVSDTTDFTPVQLFCSISAGNETFELPLSLERFSYLAKAGEGCFSKTFFAADIARIRSFLARVSDAFSNSSEAYDLTVVHDEADYVYELLDDNRVSTY